MAETRVLVYGSCVSRDMVEFLEPGYQLLGYFARQSLISAMSPPILLPAEPDLPSSFQARMVKDDFASATATMLRTLADEVDVLVLDLVDERLGVVALPGARYLTRSQEFLASGLLARLPAGLPTIPFGSKDHFVLWRTAARQFVELLRSTGLLERTLLIEATFASATDAGGRANLWQGEPARVWNARYQRYHSLLRAAGMRTHVIGKFAVAASEHVWGPSAYHYVDDAYRDIALTVVAMASESARRGPQTSR